MKLHIYNKNWLVLSNNEYKPITLYGGCNYKFQINQRYIKLVQNNMIVMILVKLIRFVEQYNVIPQWLTEIYVDTFYKIQLSFHALLLIAMILDAYRLAYMMLYQQ